MIRHWNTLLSYFCAVLCLVQPALAQETPRDQNQEFEKIVLELKAQKEISLITEELRNQGVDYFAAISPNGNVDEDLLAQQLQTTAAKFFADNPEALARSKKVLWKKIAHWMNEQAVDILLEVRTKARLYGLDVGIAYVIGALGDNLLPVFFAVIGQPEIAATLLVLPTGVMETAGYLGLKNLFRHRKVVKEYGGNASYREYEKLERETRKKLHFLGKNDIVLPLASANQDGSSVLISNDGLLRNIWNLLRPREDELTFHDLKQVALASGMSRKELRDLKNGVDEKTARETLLFEWLQKHLSDEEMAAVKMKFPASFITLKNSPELDPLVSWAGEASEVRTCEELTALMKKTPMGVSVPVLLSVWQNVMMPKIADDFKGTHINRFYRMSKSSFKLQIMGRLALKETWTEQWQARLSSAVGQLCKN